jgi:hypothetical protein
MKVALCYELNSVKIDWKLPFLPHAGEYISVAKLISERQNKQLNPKRDLYVVRNVSWFPSKDRQGSWLRSIWKFR